MFCPERLIYVFMNDFKWNLTTDFLNWIGQYCAQDSLLANQSPKDCFKSVQAVTRFRRFQRELEAAEDRADCAESNLPLIRAKHRTFVTTSSVPGSQVYMVQETRTTSQVF
uniref:Paramyosin, long form n=1 Tax=Cacopsylla melanoneura TaxID=428564 RepID=A0A8D8RBF4_9HEMI